MIFIWGSYGKERPRGFVADRCPVCRDVRTFKVVDHYKVSHIYYIPLGGGKLLGTTKTCEACGADVPWNPGEHPTIVREATASPEQLLRATNPVLAEIIAVERRVEERRRTGEGSDDPDVRWASLRDGAALDIGKLRQAGYDAGDLGKRLERWRDLPDDERQRLLADVAEARRMSDAIAAAIAFLKLVSRSVPENAGCLIGFLVCVALGLGVLALANDLGTGSIIGLSLAALVLGFATYMKINALRVRRWFERVLIPEGRRRQIDFNMLLGIIADARSDRRNLDEKLTAILDQGDALVEVLIQHKLVEVPADDTSA
jgi:hypothetical protein